MTFEQLEQLQRQVRFWIWRRAKPPFTRYEDSLPEYSTTKPLVQHNGAG